MIALIAALLALAGAWLSWRVVDHDPAAPEADSTVAEPEATARVVTPPTSTHDVEPLVVSADLSDAAPRAPDTAPPIEAAPVAAAAPEVVMGRILVTSEGGSFHGNLVSVRVIDLARRRPAVAPTVLTWTESRGRWTATAECPISVPDGAVRVDLEPHDLVSYRWSPLTATLTVASPRVTFTRHDGDGSVKLRFDVLDLDGQHPKSKVTVGWSIDWKSDGSAREFEGKAPRLLEFPRSVGADDVWFVHVHGYRVVWGRLDEAVRRVPVDGVVPVAVQLEPGWGTVVRLKFGTGEPLVGHAVRVDGIVVGHTDRAGRCLVTRDTPPATLEVWRNELAGWINLTNQIASSTGTSGVVFGSPRER